MSPKKTTQTSTRGKGFSADEKAAMKQRAKELKAAGDKESAKASCLAAIAKMGEADRAIAKKVHAIITANAPELTATTWYGMPAYANNEDKAVCFFQDAAKFKARYATLGFSEFAKLDDGDMWPTSYGLMKLTPAVEAKIVALVKKAAS